jgi:hypothetical protein
MPNPLSVSLFHPVTLSTRLDTHFAESLQGKAYASYALTEYGAKLRLHRRWANPERYFQ